MCVLFVSAFNYVWNEYQNDKISGFNRGLKMQKSHTHTHTNTHTHSAIELAQHACWNSWQLCRCVTFWDRAGDTACGWRVFRAYTPLHTTPPPPLCTPRTAVWQPLMALAHFWLLAAQHFVFQINLVCPARSFCVLCRTERVLART